MRRLLVGLLSIIVLMSVAPPASASAPTIHRFRVNEHARTQSCGYRVDLHLTGSILDIAWTDDAGNVREFQAYPRYKLVLTVHETGASFTTSVAGPARYLFEAAGGGTLVGTGTWFWFDNPVTGERGIFVTHGRFEMSLDSGMLSSSVGTIVDLCARLARAG